MVQLLANSGDPDQTLRTAASDLVLHHLQITLGLLGVSRLQWVKDAGTLYVRHFDRIV